MRQKAQVMDAKAVERALTRMGYEMLERNRGAADLCVVGIMRGGEELAARLAAQIAASEGIRVELGTLDITPFRDDRVGAGEADRSRIPFPIEGKQVVLVDDVIFTGRSVRAAIDALMSRGRPRSIQLAVLVDRGHRELPIRADYVGKNLPTSHGEMIWVQSRGRDGADAVYIMESGE